MKRKIALMLALVMVLSLVPMSAFAASTNRVNRVPVVADDHKFTDATTAPALRIQETDSDWGGAKQTFRLSLENSEWREDIEKVGKTITENVYSAEVSVFNITRLTKTTIQVEVQATTDKKAWVSIPMLVDVKDSGDIKVTVEPRDSAITGGTYTFARASAGKALVTIEDSVTFGSGSEPIKVIEIDETSLGAFDEDKKIRLRLPSDFEWITSDLKVEFKGGYSKLNDANWEEVNKADKQILEIEFSDLTTTQDVRGSIFLKGLKINAKSDAKFGDVVARVTGDVESTELLVAKYVDYGVAVKRDGDVREILAGRYEGEENDAHKLAKLVIKENIEGSLLPRNLRIEFPEWVKVTEVKVNKAKDFTFPTTGSKLVDFSTNSDRNVVEFTPEVDGKGDLELTFYVSVEADATGDITALVSGRGLSGEEFEVVLGKALAPVEVKTTVEDVRVGVKNQSIGNITINETKAGALKKDKVVEVELENGFVWNAKPSVEVVEGDLKVDNITINGEKLTFKVTRDSDEASVIEITGGKVDLWRTLPQGEFVVSIGGDALVRNNGDKKDQFDTKWVAEAAIANVVTLAPGEIARQEAAFTIGSTTFTVGGKTVQADVAPVVKNNRTFVPIAWTAMALDVNYVWDNGTKTVTLFGDRTVQMTIGSKTMLVNGVPMTMDVAPYVENNRTFVPVAWAAIALGVDYTWDAPTQTVTFN
ncbi:copper amine oxidase N-terminal domain-containing protein [Natronincola ferrireducens]|uniref:Copper amine oxidase N-terminal domain-containing protein n=1 Tax=Natronincola ferrireducens TaxID=393762 RepID=A0A1G8X1X1_9FIRM|nr:copper amine oxidase N-terminal domain-containing protein [Natronincola ferrireducens]SDJ84337.1 Copper amine oxidase N-terminal domain-containing protein [Natronincola ferrireducens]